GRGRDNANPAAPLRRLSWLRPRRPLGAGALHPRRPPDPWPLRAELLAGAASRSSRAIYRPARLQLASRRKPGPILQRLGGGSVDPGFHRDAVNFSGAIERGGAATPA